MSKQEPSSLEQAKEPSTMREAISMIEKEIHESGSPTAEVKTTSVGKKETEPSEGSEEQGKVETPKARLWIVDEQGNKIPAIFKADGKDYVAETPDQIKTWIGHGIHSSSRNETLNKREKDLRENEEMVRLIFDAYQDGRLKVIDKGKEKSLSAPGAVRKEEESETEEDIISDPEMLKAKSELKALREEIEEIKNQNKTLQRAYLSEKMEEEKKKIDGEIESYSRSYPLAKKRVKDVWRLLGEYDESNQPVYDVEAAMKKIHDESISEFRDFLKEHPEFTKEDKEKAVAQYLKDKSEKEAAPVIAPSGLPAGGASPTPEKESKIKSMRDAIDQIKEELSSQQKAKEKF